jgi:hypothetical protein
MEQKYECQFCESIPSDEMKVLDEREGVVTMDPTKEPMPAFGVPLRIHTKCGGPVFIA